MCKAYDVMTDTSQSAPVATALPSDRFLDRELSWLAFNQRVLELAQDQDMELLERVKYLSIFASNLDEFFMVRVAGLKRRLATGMAKKTISGMLPTEVHSAVLAESYERIHRSNLVGMGVLPLQYKNGENALSLGLTGTETFTISGISQDIHTLKELKVTALK